MSGLFAIPGLWTGDRSPRCPYSPRRNIAEDQIDDLSDAEVDVLLEIYEVLRLTPGNGRLLRQAGNM
jgi:hypothetical protein